MITTGALLHGDVPGHLDFDPAEHPVALQLGGSEPGELAECARLGERWGYDEINLNCGCPSPRVQRGSFGACLMADPALVRDCVSAMRAAVSIPITVKHRTGVDRIEEYGFVRDFVGTVAQGGASTFIVHARNAWLSGLSPKENREVPPLRYEMVDRLKRDFPQVRLVLNGGLRSLDEANDHLRRLDGVMLGRQAYQHPWVLAQVDRRLYPDGEAGSGHTDDLTARRQIAGQLQVYAARMRGDGVPLRAVVRHALGLFNGLPGARNWRRLLSDSQLLAEGDPALIARAASLVFPEPERMAV